MKVLVCGGRYFDDAKRMYDILDKYPISHVVNGGASGADELATVYAKRLGIPFTVYPADWSSGKAAGPTRNRKMLDAEKPDLVIAFSGGTGTAHMKRIAREGGYQVVEA